VGPSAFLHCIRDDVAFLILSDVGDVFVVVEFVV
jgi:hypothetical protein